MTNACDLDRSMRSRPLRAACLPCAVALALLASACGPRGAAPASAPRGAEALYQSPPLRGERSVGVDVLWVRKEPNPDPEADEDLEVAGVTRVRLRVAPNPAGVVTIGVAEQFPGGAGDTWKAAVWLAARAASRALGREVAEHRFLAETQGFIDGPSAGALFTAGFLAAALGVPLRPEVTITGTMTPDGTVGRVGGVVLKLEAAVKAGKRIIGYPAGDGLVKGSKGGYLNLESLAAERGARAVPVRDLYEAFALLTGRELPPLPEATPGELALPRSLSEGLQRRAREWLKEAEGREARALAEVREEAARTRLTGSLEAARAYARVARDAAGRGAAGLSYYAAFRSLAWTDSATRLSGLKDLWQGWLAARARALTAVAAEQQLQRAAAKLSEEAALKARLCPGPRRRASQAQPRVAPRGAPSPRVAPRVAPSPGVAPRVAPSPRVAPRVAPSPSVDAHALAEAILARARAGASETRALGVERTRLGERRPGTVGEALAVVAAYAELFQGAAYARLGARKLGRLAGLLVGAATDPAKALPAEHEVLDAVRFPALAGSRARLARELSTLVEPGSRPLTWTAGRRRAIADQLFAAAKANLDYLHSLLPAGEAGANAQKLLAEHSADYVTAELGVTRAGRLVILPGLVGGQASARVGVAQERLVVLGAAVASFLASSQLLAKMFTVGLDIGTGKVVTAVGSAEQLTYALHRARRFALQAAHRAAVRAGRVPAYARVLLGAADALRQENLSGQVKALELFWRAGLYCQVAEQMAHQP